MENTFKVDITFLGQVFLEDNTSTKEDVTKLVTFKKLDRTDSNQHLLHFLISSMIEYKKGEGGAEDKFWIEYTKMHDLAKAAINTLMIIGDGVTEGDRTQILADSFALINFGQIFATDHALVFFLQSKKSGKASVTATQP